jgi:hypothetical protein
MYRFGSERYLKKRKKFPNKNILNMCGDSQDLLGLYKWQVSCQRKKTGFWPLAAGCWRFVLRVTGGGWRVTIYGLREARDEIFDLAYANWFCLTLNFISSYTLFCK